MEANYSEIQELLQQRAATDSQQYVRLRSISLLEALSLIIQSMTLLWEMSLSLK